MSGIPFRTRRRKRGCAEPIRCYNHHIALRLTYFEAEVLHNLLTDEGYEPTHYEAAAAKRIRTKAALAADADQWEAQKKNITRRLKRLRDRHKAQESSGVAPDPFEKITINYLEDMLTNETRERVFKLS